MENGYIYTRVSTLIQVDGFSLDAQEEEIRAFAKMHGINIIGKYSDEGKSGKNAEHRPAFNQMMEDIRSKKDSIKYILVFKLSRFARNTSDTAKYLQELASYGIGLLGVKDGIDTSTATGKMIANIMGAVAEVELENIHEQTLAGRQQKARSGLWNGAQAPFGYALENKFLVVCPEEAEIVKEIFHLYVEEGQTIRYITKKLNDEGVKREQRGNTRFSVFTERTVRSILKNPVYAGKIAYGRRHTVKVEGTNNETKVVKQDDESKIILVEGVHEAIVTPEMFAKAEIRLGENVRHRKTRSDSTTVYPLTGLIRVRTAVRIYSDIQHLQDQGRMGRKDSIPGISPIAVYQGEIGMEFPVPLRTSITAAQSWKRKSVMLLHPWFQSLSLLNWCPRRLTVQQT